MGSDGHGTDHLPELLGKGRDPNCYLDEQGIIHAVTEYTFSRDSETRNIIYFAWFACHRINALGVNHVFSEALKHFFRDKDVTCLACISDGRRKH